MAEKNKHKHRRRSSKKCRQALIKESSKKVRVGNMQSINKYT